jgi:hypothetical protein
MHDSKPLPGDKIKDRKLKHIVPLRQSIRGAGDGDRPRKLLPPRRAPLAIG